MKNNLDTIDKPLWLKNITQEMIENDPLPLHNILKDSLYYPGAGSDGKPVKWFAGNGNVHSFVYCDYGVSKHKFLDDLYGYQGFSGYDILARRDVRMNELIPNGWTPMLPEARDGDPKKFRDVIQNPFAIWVVFERMFGFSDAHGPKRFSLLYLCSEGVAGYQALYNSNRLKPKILFLIQHGFGYNWTNFENPELILARSVRANVQGLPDYLVGRNKPDTDGSHWPDDYPNTPVIEVLVGEFYVWASK